MKVNSNGNKSTEDKDLRKRNGQSNPWSTGYAQTNGSSNHKHVPTSARRNLPEIEFMERESLLTQMFQVKEFRGLYNIFLVILINLTIYTIVSDIVETGCIDLGFQNIKSSFGKPMKTLSLLVGMHLSTLFVIYPTFTFWTKLRRGSRSLADLVFSILILIFASYFISIPITMHWADPLPVASGATVVVEQVRLLMKMYAFLRTNVARVVQGQSESNTPNVNVKSEKGITTQNMPTFSSYAYFLYAPTLLYRDSYPRTKDIRWGFIIRNLIEFFGCIFVYNLLHRICGYVLFENIGIVGQTLTTRRVLRAVFFQMIPGGVGWLLGFFVLLHTSQNITAELLRFADRQFYKDWWNSSSYSSFYRNWNLPVHHFLYTYIYRDAMKLGFRSNFVPTICVFLVSAIVHEYVLIFVLRFFYPVLLIFFGGFGLTLNFVQTSESIGNTFIWWSLITGKALLLFFYSTEYFARLNNCPAAENPIVDFFVPRSWTCGVYSWDSGITT